MNAMPQKIARMAEYGAEKNASLLKWTTLIIWACSLAAEVGTFAFNKKLPEKEKSFIIKQELTAGGISLAIMYLLADQFEKAGEWLVQTARLLPEELPVQWRTESAVQKILKGNKQFLKQELKGNAAWIKKLAGFQKGVSVIAGTLGAILAFNITTPLVSNKIASYFQNKSLAEKNVKPTNVLANAAFQANLASRFSNLPVNRYPSYPVSPLRVSGSSVGSTFGRMGV